MVNHKKQHITPSGLSVLLALSLKPRHGYELMAQIREDSKGRILIGPGALYGTIKELMTKGYIKEHKSTDTEKRRRYYEVTKKGTDTLQAELNYFDHVISLANQRKTNPIKEA